MVKNRANNDYFSDPLADPLGTRRGPLWSADPSLKTAGLMQLIRRPHNNRRSLLDIHEPIDQSFILCPMQCNA